MGLRPLRHIGKCCMFLPARDEPSREAMTTLPTSGSRRSVMVIFGALLVTQFLSGLDTIILVTALPTIVGDLGGLHELSWVLTAYLLSSTVSSPILGRLSDLVGRKPVFQV